MKSLELLNVDASGFFPPVCRNESVNLDFLAKVPLNFNIMTDRYETRPDFILILKDAVPLEINDMILKYLTLSNSWQKSLVSGGASGPLESKNRQSDSLFFDRLCDPQIGMTVQNTLMQSIQYYSSFFGVDIGGSMESFYAIRYPQSGEYKVHSDQGPGLSRSVSAVMYLNDDFEGGDLYFPNQEVTIRPSPGTIVLFPSSFTHKHASLPVINGIKYAIVSWWA